MAYSLAWLCLVIKTQEGCGKSASRMTLKNLFSQEEWHAYRRRLPGLAALTAL
jgi:hypothetical protein